MATITTKWTLEDYHHMIATGLLDDKNVELIQGDVVEVAPEGKPHAYFSTRSDKYLTKLLGDRALVLQAKPITLPNQSEPQPDISVVQPLDEEYLEHHPYVENVFWLIEYSDTTLKKDLELKSSTYAEVGIREYWIVNLRERTLIVFREPKAGKYNSRRDYTSGRLYPLSFPSVQIEVSAIIKK